MIPAISLHARAGRSFLMQCIRNYSQDVKHYKLVIAGGGSGGCAVAARLTKEFGQGNVAVVDPAEVTLIDKTCVYERTLLLYTYVCIFLLYFLCIS